MPEGPRRDYLRLLMALSFLGCLYPALDPKWGFGFFGLAAWTGAFWLVLFLCLRSLLVGSIARRAGWMLFVLAVGLGTAALLMGTEEVSGSPTRHFLRAGSQIVSTLILLKTTGAVLLNVFAPGRVDGNRIWGAVCVYVLMGLTWAHIYGLLAHFDTPVLVVQSRGPDGQLLFAGRVDTLSTHLYFSFVTLTTVGYGDLAPGSNLSRLLATVEAICGQLYLTVLVARLIGLHITHSQVDPVAPTSGGGIEGGGPVGRPDR